MHIAHHPDNDGWYSTHESICRACAAQEREQKQDEKPDPGAKRYLSYDRPADRPLPKRE